MARGETFRRRHHEEARGLVAVELVPELAPCQLPLTPGGYLIPELLVIGRALGLRESTRASGKGGAAMDAGPGDLVHFFAGHPDTPSSL